MTLSDDQKQIVRETWAQVVPIADTAGNLFYGRLFELDPSLQPLFKGISIHEQQRKLMQTLAVAVKSLDNLEQLVPVLETLGRRHADYGVKDSAYATGLTALLWTLERGLGEGYTPAVGEAWTATYTLVTGVMRRAAVPPRRL